MRKIKVLMGMLMTIVCCMALSVTVKLRRYAVVGVSTPDKKTIPGECSFGGSFMNLDSSKYYFIQFVGPCEFSGSVKGYT